MVSLHPEACAAYNRDAEQLRAQVVLKQFPDHPSQADPDLHVAGTLGPDDLVGPPTLQYQDHLGNEVARWSPQAEDAQGLEGDAHQQFIEFCRRVHANSALKDIVSETFLREQIFQWLVTDPSCAEHFSDYLQGRVSCSIVQAVYAVPIAHLRIQEPVSIGPVRFIPITRQMMDRWEHQLLAQSDSEHRSGVSQLVQRQRKRLQGYAAGTVSLVAEKSRACELVVESVEQALSALRFFEPGSVDPYQMSYVVPLGQESIGTVTTFVLENSTPTWWSESSLVKHGKDSLLSSQDISEIRAAGLDILSKILGASDRTQFQRRLLESLTVYSRVSISNKLSDKLVFALVALESIFLKDQSEPIQQNLGERIAFLIGRDLTERKAIVSATKRIYGMRSRLLHHGKEVVEESSLREFFEYAWRALHTLVMNSGDFKSVDEILNRLDERKLS